MAETIPVVDLFAGPGGLGEGFSAFRDETGAQPFRIAVSAEKDEAAHRTLRLRAFFRQFNGDAPDSYYRYIAGDKDIDLATEFPDEWRDAELEALKIELGTETGNKALEARIADRLSDLSDPWILIGGPPCQAYSLVGRARQKGIKDYRPEADARHYLYQEYLWIIRQFRPAAFVMENVKGLLSSSVDGGLIFQQMLRDLAAPNGPEPKYRIHALTNETVFQDGDDPAGLRVRDFLVRSEDFGVPQARHRVFLIGLREDLGLTAPRLPKALLPQKFARAKDVLEYMSPLRSGLSRMDDGRSAWLDLVTEHATELDAICANDSDMEDLALTFLEIGANLRGRAANYDRSCYAPYYGVSPDCTRELRDWLEDPRLLAMPNHETRAHMSSDLCRYLFAAVFAFERGVSPKASDFPAELAPRHSNWKSGKFNDRFRVQLSNAPSSTVTSHIAKDGHYFIHYDPYQCRSLTVREAARLQTFPDNYFFEGNRTQQFVQVGNAVPPYLARQIAEAVWKAVCEWK